MVTLPRLPVPVPLSKVGWDRGAEGWLYLRAPAKVNLYLEVLGRREDGFHELETVMTPLHISDRLWLRSRPQAFGMQLTARGRFADAAPTDTSNLVIKALTGLQEFAGLKQGAEVFLEKNIPAEAGLGGGSSDAATALILANAAWGLDLCLSELQQVAAKIGSDAPFFLTGGAAICRGRGEIISPQGSPAGCACVVAKPRVGLSTREVYAALPADTLTHEQTSAASISDALTQGNWREVSRRLYNRLQLPAERLSDAMSPLIQLMSRVCNCKALMTGSGSAVFALMANRRAARHAASRLRQSGVGWAVATATA